MLFGAATKHLTCSFCLGGLPLKICTQGRGFQISPSHLKPFKQFSSTQDIRGSNCSRPHPARPMGPQGGDLYSHTTASDPLARRPYEKAAERKPSVSNCGVAQLRGAEQNSNARTQRSFAFLQAFAVIRTKTKRKIKFKQIRI